ncbi:MAG: hypothetical protein LBS89_00510, partial [Zoogloeaceae bacterium]|nr:hypothetical protein [Zoogloeaceae bacterium]
QIYRYLVKNDYTDDADKITDTYRDNKDSGTLAPLPEELQPYAPQLVELIDRVAAGWPEPANGRESKTIPLNENFQKKEFRALWQRINHKAVYRVAFDSEELVNKAVAALDTLHVTPLQYTVQQGEQRDETRYDDLKGGTGFVEGKHKTEKLMASAHSAVKYDLIGEIADGTQLTRRTVAAMLQGMNVAVFAQFKRNPENFIAEAIRLIKEQKATAIIEHLAYDPTEDRFDAGIFTATQTGQDFSRAGEKLEKHIYDYALTASKIERDFVKKLDGSDEVMVYAKLPKGFLIPTPVGDYNPDWAISFREGAVKHIYFVAETKGSMSSMKLRGIEKSKLDCARKFFERISQQHAAEKVRYDVVDSFGRLMAIVK